MAAARPSFADPCPIRVPADLVMLRTTFSDANQYGAFVRRDLDHTEASGATGASRAGAGQQVRLDRLWGFSRKPSGRTNTQRAPL